MATHISQNAQPSKQQSSEFAMQVPFAAVSLKTFLAEFMPQPDVATRRRDKDFKHMFDKMPANNNSEDDFYHTLIQCFCEQNICPNYSAGRITKSEMVDDHAALFLTNDKKSIIWNRHWALQCLAIICKPHYHDDDPFAENAKSDKRNADCRKTTRDLLTTIASKVFSRQHRCFFFTVLILGDSARLLRWDRSGVVITEPFWYKRTPHLGSFLWRFAHLSPVQQGCDSSAEVVQRGSVDAKLIEKFTAERPSTMNEYVHVMFCNSMKDESWLWWKLRIVPEVNESALEGPEQRSGSKKRTRGDHLSGPSTKRRRYAGGRAISNDSNDERRARYFLVGKPHFHSSSLPGRGTRGYIALDCEEEVPVFLKDTWRCDPLPMIREGCVLRALNEAHVENVPTLVCHGDIENQCTRTQDLRKNVSAGQKDNSPRNLIHYRMVEREICRPLRDYETDKQFLHLVADCLKAHEQAVERVGVMHADISLGNMLIFEQYRLDQNEEGCFRRVGMLCDWEFSKPVHTTRNGEKVAQRAPTDVCTWEMAGVHLADHPGTPITIPDELEAFFHLILMVTVRDQRSNLGSNEWAFRKDYFVDCTENPKPGERYMTCTKLKRKAMYEGKIMYKATPLRIFRSADDKRIHPFGDLLSMLLTLFRAHYSATLYDEWHNRPKRRLRSNTGQHVVEPPSCIIRLEPDELVRRRELAAGLKSHRAMQDLILLIAEGDWLGSKKRDCEIDQGKEDIDIPHMIFTCEAYP
ncbi:hypothetical protein BKA93DRAFT_516591 [Sparassis latifolia]